MTVPEKIHQLIQQFELNLEAYKRGNYNETQVRLEFIDPFFKELGWDVHNELGYAEAFKDVIHEDAIKVGGATKAPDYCFRIGGTRKFFLEAKKPSVNIKGDVHPAYQLRRYAWSAKLPLSILTDFEEFAVYECRKRPAKTDKASGDRILYLTFREYAERWEEISAIFSKEAVLKGHFDRYVEKGAKRPTSEVDREFLKEIESWRELLAKNIALRNPRLGVRELNYAVQLTIDRIIFLRICEDRGIETYGQLQALCGGPRIYPRLLEIFYRADDKYNSGLFHFREEKGRHSHSDALTPALLLDDRVLKTILSRLYYPECPYEFSVMPAEILGNVYEQFLGKVIRLTAGHQAKIEEKPEVRKAGGVYYTPKYIVDYIVKQTVGKLCEGKTPRQIEKLRLLDPACGSGSFLLGAFQYLLDYHRDHYETEIRESGFQKRRQQQIYQGRGGGWLLTTAEKKRILLNNIYGVDIDEQAVEVTKLSLLLKVLENENQDTLKSQLTLWRERALPDLGDNIKCGNSLIGSDFYQGQQMNLFDAEEQRRINAFDWEEEFKEVFPPSKGGRGDVGFDAVIGNPPWGAEYNKAEKEYLRIRFGRIHVRTPESFNYFIAQMWNCTIQRGIVGVIIPSSFLTQHEFSRTRKMIIETATVKRICNLGDGVFLKVTAPSTILIFSTPDKQKESSYLDLRKVERNILPDALLEERCTRNPLTIDFNSDSYAFQVRNHVEIFNKCYTWPKLKDVAEEVATGISSGLDKAYIYTSDEANKLGLEKALLRKLVIGGEIHRYSLQPRSQKQIIYLTPNDNIEDYPNCYSILKPYRERLLKRREAANGKIPWFSLNWPRRVKLFENPKILIRQTADRILAAYDEEKWYCLKSAIIIQLKTSHKIRYEYLLALLNSNLMYFLYTDLVGEQFRIFPEVKPVQLFKLPIRPINFSDPADKAHHDRMAQLVETMLDLHKRLNAAALPQEKTRLQRQITAADRQIDQLVYELYDLTPEEIQIVEDAVK